MEAFDKTIPMESDQGRANEWRNDEKRRRDARRSLELINKTLQSLRLESLHESQEFVLRRVRSDWEYKVMNQKSPDESGSSQKWKADTRLGGGYYGSTSRRMFCTNFSHFPSVVSKQNREN